MIHEPPRHRKSLHPVAGGEVAFPRAGRKNSCNGGRRNGASARGPPALVEIAPSWTARPYWPGCADSGDGY
jgi:hypothetical protein